MSKKGLLSLIFCFYVFFLSAQRAAIEGYIRHNTEALPFVSVYIEGTGLGAVSDENGKYLIENIPVGKHTLTASSVGFDKYQTTLNLLDAKKLIHNIELVESQKMLDEVVVSGTLKEVARRESPVPIDVFSAKFFKSNPTPSLVESMQNINGIRAQINCNVCYTSDIRINGLDGPYTMVLIDGMPIVSGLSTVYGLNGIPQDLIERIEIVKGPASTLYGSEAVGGIVNIITKSTERASKVHVDLFADSYGALNTDVSAKLKAGKKATSLIGLNHYYYQNKVDINGDNFTDIPLQNRISVFNKWNFSRKDNKVFSIAGRFVTENRWGGELQWNESYRGGEEVYGESIYTDRIEAIGIYQLPVEEDITLMFSGNIHVQNSVYGNTTYLGDQRIAFGQLNWHKNFEKHVVQLGTALRYTVYDDNTPATANAGSPESSLILNKPSITYLPGVYLQDEWTLNPQHKVLLGLRYDYNSLHGNIVTPRLNYKWNDKSKRHIARVSLGNGYRVANVFTEDHAALTGSRDVVFVNDLLPETSWNANINLEKKVYTKNDGIIDIDVSGFYTYFTNKIFADYLTDPNLIIYDNLGGYAVSNGVSLNLNYTKKLFSANVGATAMNVYTFENGIKERQPFTEQITGVWSLNYTFGQTGIKASYTGNIYGPMALPLLSDLDPRSDQSPIWSIQNIQISKTFKQGFELYLGVKNLLNWTPDQNEPFLIARAFDPFDKQVQFDPDGNAIATADNPYGLTFDASYVYAPIQGIRGFFGLRFNLK